ARRNDINSLPSRECKRAVAQAIFSPLREPEGALLDLYAVKVVAIPKKARRSPRRILYGILRVVLLCIAAFYACTLLGFVALRWLNPPFTAVQAERRVQSWI